MTDILWEPSIDQIDKTTLKAFMNLVNQDFDQSFETYQDLYQWSVESPAQFWETFWSFSGLISHAPYQNVLTETPEMMGSQFFEGATLNYAENCLQDRDEKTAILFKDEAGVDQAYTYQQLAEEVLKYQDYFKKIGLKKGDRIAAVTANIPEAIFCFLAAASLGCIWSSCSPDFGLTSILERFTQIEPKLIFVVNGYRYNGKLIDLSAKWEALIPNLPTVDHVLIHSYQEDVAFPNLDVPIQDTMQLKAVSDDLSFEPVPFNHPLYILYSSGTTGKPKAIVHGHGGTLIQHLKEHRLHCDLKPNDRLFYFTTCGWMMWNWLVTGLASGVAIVLYEGSPFYPNEMTCWQLIDDLSITHFGTSAKFIAASQEKGVSPKSMLSLESLSMVLSTGSPLLDCHFDYLMTDLKKDLHIASISGGTDIVSCFVGGVATLPVRRGFLQARGLGMAVEAYTDSGTPVIGEQGELVCTKPFPSMPVSFWNDPNGDRYRGSYFDRFKGIWHHGDYIQIEVDGSVKMLGRSDATLNPGGVRIGTAELYEALASLPQIKDCIIAGRRLPDDEEIVVFVVMATGCELDLDQAKSIKRHVRSALSPRHVPAYILEVTDIPLTLNGKRCEIAVKKILNDTTCDVSHFSVANEASLIEIRAVVDQSFDLVS
ncbi:acetoacetate--CoA ligase [bacterium]|jgi:acetoacetyl-CoA synthetase|nr:acetoacetate--CoA ligase [bacterium]